MTRSTQKKFDPRRIRAALMLVQSSIPKIAKRRGCGVSSLYAVLDGKRPGRDPKIMAAVADMEEITKGVLSA